MIQIGGVYTTFCQEEGILLQKYQDGNGRCIATLFKSIGVRSRFDSPDYRLSTLSCRLFAGDQPARIYHIAFLIVPPQHSWSSSFQVPPIDQQ